MKTVIKNYAPLFPKGEISKINKIFKNTYIF